MRKKTLDDSYSKISPTAKGVAYFRSLAGIAYSVEIARACDAKKVVREMFDIDASKLMWMAPIIESRYKSIDHAVREYIVHHRHVRNIVELASGLSPRGLICTKDYNINYIEIDLQDILNEKKKIVKNILSCDFCGGISRPNLKFIEGNVLHRETFDNLEIRLEEGPIVFICEGLLPYFSYKEKTILIKNIIHLLKKHGGVLITPDISSKERIKVMLQMDPNLAKAIEFLSGVTHCDIEANSFLSLNEARNFFGDNGFNVTEYRQCDIVPNLRSLSLVSDVEMPKVKAMLERGYIWAMELK